MMAHGSYIYSNALWTFINGMRNREIDKSIEWMQWYEFRVWIIVHCPFMLVVCKFVLLVNILTFVVIGHFVILHGIHCEYFRMIEYAKALNDQCIKQNDFLNWESFKSILPCLTQSDEVGPVIHFWLFIATSDKRGNWILFGIWGWNKHRLIQM